MVNEKEAAANTEWQEHLVITDISGVKVCLDCAITEEDVDNPNSIYVR